MLYVVVGSGVCRGGRWYFCYGGRTSRHLNGEREREKVWGVGKARGERGSGGSVRHYSRHTDPPSPLLHER